MSSISNNTSYLKPPECPFQEAYGRSLGSIEGDDIHKRVIRLFEDKKFGEGVETALSFKSKFAKGNSLLLAIQKYSGHYDTIIPALQKMPDLTKFDKELKEYLIYEAKP